MATIKAHFDGKTFVPDEPVDVPVNQAVTVMVEGATALQPAMTEAEFEKFLAEMDRDSVAVDHVVDWSRDKTSIRERWMILVDTSVLGRLCHANDPFRPVVLSTLRTYRRRGTPLVVAPQSLYEFWVVATRPADVNGLAMSVEQALPWLAHYQNFFTILPDPPKMVECWERLLRIYKTIGKQAHDARLVAAMELHGITTLLTFNVNHFARYPIEVIDPRNVVSV